jgi:hypothetical protein
LKGTLLILPSLITGVSKGPPQEGQRSNRPVFGKVLPQSAQDSSQVFIGKFSSQK